MQWLYSCTTALQQSVGTEHVLLCETSTTLGTPIWYLRRLLHDVIENPVPQWALVLLRFCMASVMLVEEYEILKLYKLSSTYRWSTPFTDIVLCICHWVLHIQIQTSILKNAVLHLWSTLYINNGLEAGYMEHSKMECCIYIYILSPTFLYRALNLYIICVAISSVCEVPFAQDCVLTAGGR